MKSNEVKVVYRFFDTKLNLKDQKLFDRLMHGSADMKDEFRNISILRELISDYSSHNFDSGFAGKVLSKLKQNIVLPDNIIMDLFAMLFRKSAVIGLSFSLILILVNMLSTGNISLDGIFGIKEHSFDRIIDLF